MLGFATALGVLGALFLVLSSLVLMKSVPVVTATAEADLSSLPMSNNSSTATSPSFAIYLVSLFLLRVSHGSLAGLWCSYSESSLD